MLVYTDIIIININIGCINSLIIIRLLLLGYYYVVGLHFVNSTGNPNTMLFSRIWVLNKNNKNKMRYIINSVF